MSIFDGNARGRSARARTGVAFSNREPQMKRTALLFGAVAAGALACANAHFAAAAAAVAQDPPAAVVPPADHPPRVDVALLLDTSNSMDGLIDQAKSQLWAIVRQFADARKDGRPPTLRVALFEYGNTKLPATEGYLRQVVPLTDDLDKLSQALFALTTDGGDEYCGQVIDEAITRLDWSKDAGAYKTIFIAGNEPFTQGEVDYRSACARAVGERVIVNTIHCGGRDEGARGMWQDGAMLGKGRFFNIDQDRRLPDVPCPQDPRLAELNGALNDTYLWYGGRAARDEMQSNQQAQDSNAAKMGGQAAAQRAAVKGGNAYRNVGRDLVDSYAADPAILETLKEEELPEPMQKMTPEERKAHVEEMARTRAAIQTEIGKLTVEREAYLAEHRKRHAGETGEKTLGDAVVEVVREQLGTAGYDAADTDD